jgi:hypothetical protein
MTAWPRPDSTDRSTLSGGDMTLFEWLAQVCAELQWPVMRAHDMLDETRWSDMYEAGISPREAAARMRAETNAGA